MRCRLGSYLVDSANRIILYGDAVVQMPPKSVDLLLCLLDHDGGIALKKTLTTNEASDMEGSAARHYGLIVVVALVMSGMALALTGFR